MFIDQTALIRQNAPQLYYGVAVTDLDYDGQFELFIAGFGFPNRILKWDGEAFIDIADSVLADATRQAIGVAACDINGDGREEIYVLNTDTFAGMKQFADRLFLFRGRKWVDLFTLEENEAVLNLTAGRSVAALDRGGSGIYGFFVANYGGPMRLYELNNEGLLEDIAPLARLDLTTGGRSLVALPMISQQMDVFAGNENGPNYLFVNQGDGTFREEAYYYGLNDPLEHVRGIAVLDANNDGQFDLVYGNWEGPHRLFVRTERGFRNIAPLEMSNPSRIRTVIAADFDNDGYEEIFFNNMGQPNRLFGQRNGQWVRLDIGQAAEPTGLGTGAAVGDFDGDGNLELLITHGESGLQSLTYYRVQPNQHHWLRVLPLTQYGAPARGAVVRLVAGDHIQIRAIDAGSGYLCQMEPVAHFGLGANPAPIEYVEVLWLDGQSVRLKSPKFDQLLQVEHPET